MLPMTRKHFLRNGLAGIAATGLSAPAKSAGLVAGDALAGPVTVDRINPVIRLYPAKAASRSGELRFGPGELSIMLPFLGAGELLWTVQVNEPGEYDLALCYSTTKPGTPVTIEAGASKVDFAAPVTEGYFYPYPGGPSENPGDPDSDSFWTMRQYYLFERVSVPGRITLTRGVNVVRLKVAGEKGEEIFRLRSLELTPSAQRGAVEAEKALAKSRRANTDWFADAGYGIWFHFLNLTMPRHGPQIPYEQAINLLDVKKLAQMVADCGARYLIWAVNHGYPTCPAPIASWEKLHPGWTTKRDLIGELADALGKHGIRLMLYMNCPGIGQLVQQNGTALDLPAFSETDYANQLCDVFREFGNRYGSRLAGYWFDSWFQTTESYPNLPHRALFEAVKTGNPDRLVSLNYWAFPIETEWQDYWSGEITDLPAKPFKARYIGRGAGHGLQGHSAIRFDDPWFHIVQDKPIDAPRYTADVLADYIRTCQGDRVPVTLGVGIYQDGTIAEESFAVLKRLRQKIRGGTKPRPKP